MVRSLVIHVHPNSKVTIATEAMIKLAAALEQLTRLHRLQLFVNQTNKTSAEVLLSHSCVPWLTNFTTNMAGERLAGFLNSHPHITILNLRSLRFPPNFPTPHLLPQLKRLHIIGNAAASIISGSPVSQLHISPTTQSLDLEIQTLESHIAQSTSNIDHVTMHMSEFTDLAPMPWYTEFIANLGHLHYLSITSDARFMLESNEARATVFSVFQSLKHLKTIEWQDNVSAPGKREFSGLFLSECAPRCPSLRRATIGWYEEGMWDSITRDYTPESSLSLGEVEASVV